MFEQASIDTRGMLKSPWSITVSVAGQALALTASILISLIHTDALPRSSSITTITAPGGRLKPAEPSTRPATIQRAPVSRRVFVLPSKSTDTAASRSHDGAISLLPDDLGVGSAGWGDSGLSFARGTGLPGTLVSQLPPAPPPPVTRIVEKPSAQVVSKPVAVSSGVQAAKLMRMVKPAYPALAAQARISGTVRLAAVIARDGAIQNLQVISGHPLLTPAAVDAVKQWRYHPTLLNGEAVEVITQIDVNFTLSR